MRCALPWPTSSGWSAIGDGRGRAKGARFSALWKSSLLPSKQAAPDAAIPVIRQMYMRTKEF